MDEHDASPGSLIGESCWGRTLSGSDLDRVLAVAKEKRVGRSGVVVHASSPARHWVGILSGLVVQSVTHADGHASFLSAVGDGAWFGEGTLINRGTWGYDAIALQESRVVLLPLATFEWLRETSLPFNHFIQSLMNARLGTFTRLLLSTRHASTDSRVAMAIANLFVTVDDSRPTFVRISQAELALLAGTSRQRANDALKRLNQRGLVQPRRLGLDVMDLDGLRAVALGDL